MSSLTRLSLPKVTEEASILAGWDETIEGASWQNSGFRASLAAHAVAHQSVVCGTRQPNDQSSTNGDWISWTTSFAPNRVCRVASSHNGSVVAVATDGGTVSILRGADGKVIATRRVAQEGVRVPAEVSFVGGSSMTREALVIEPPEDGPPILVSNIDGGRLNSANPGSVSEAARSMSIQGLVLEETENIQSLRGCFLTPNKIRFALVDGDGRLAIQDYSIQEKHAELVRKNVDLGRSAKNDRKWEVDYNVDMRVQGVGTNQTFLVLSTYCGMATKVCWIDLKNLSVSCEHTLSQSGLKRPRVETLEPLFSCSEDSSLALAIGTTAEIEIVQVLIDATEGSSKATSPHVIYAIPLPPSVQSLSIAPIPRESGSYSFRCKYWLGGENHECGSFFSRSHGHNGSVIGAVRMSIQRGQFDQASQLVQETGADILIGDAYAKFHPSEIYLMRLKHVLANGNVSNEEAMAASRECLQRLASGAMSGNDQGRLAFLAATDTMIQWPAEISTKVPPTVSEIVLALSAFSSVMASVVNAIGEGDASKFIEKKKVLNDKLTAMKYIDSIVEDGKLIRVTERFGDIRSPKELFACLVEHDYFLAAEQLWRSSLRSKMTTEAMVSSMLVVTPKVDPRIYSNLLQEVILPSLTINHELLPPLLAWSCKTADAFDDEVGNSHSLDKSIFLLEIVDRATKSLRARVHTSFASYSPFVGKTDSRSARPSSTKNSTMDLTTSDSSFLFSVSSPSQESRHSNDEGSIGSPSLERPNPAMLKMGRMKGGAQKSRLGQLASLTEAVDEGEEGVELKLHYARLLKQARSLGLQRRLVYLRTFSSCGGAQYIAKELVRSFSLSASSHEERIESVSKHGKEFCEQAGANFDEALLQYANELCKGGNTSREAIQEASSIARCCSSPEIKCRVTLIALRAALFCRYSPPWLSKLSLEAIQWASGDSALRSELEESSRLLLIDGIVGRYCGEGAKELFRVDNPRHAARLLEYVAQHIHCDTVLSDVLDLCEAFTHLSQENACSLIIQHAMLEGANDVCCSALESLYVRNVALARTTFAKVMSFISDLIGDCSAANGNSSIRQKQALLATACACEIIPVALSHANYSAGGYENEFSSSHVDESRLESLLQDYEKIRTLQIDHSLFLSLSDLHRPNKLVELVFQMFVPIVKAYAGEKPQSSSTIVTRTRRVCSLLAGCSHIKDTDLWYAAAGASACRLAWQMEGRQCMDFLSDLGVLESTQDAVAARACVAVALSLCLKASQQPGAASVLAGMKYLVMASSLLQDNALLSCPNGFLSATLALGELSDIVGQVLVRTDEGFGEGLDEFRKELHKIAAKKRWSFPTATKSSKNDISDSLRLRRPVLHSSWYVGDGLLLPPVEALSRGIEYCKYSMGAHNGSPRPLLEDAGLNLHYFLEGRGSHSLALRLLCNSTVSRLCAVGGVASFHLLAEAHQQTATSLLERYLGGVGNGITSKLVDSQLAVSFLLCLPLKQAFKVYRSSLPTAISTRDFARVGTLANVGKVAGSEDPIISSGDGAGFGWKKQHKFVAQCELLATRAEWWGVLQEYHVEFDPHRFDDSGGQKKPKALSGSKYAKSLVPMLIANLSKNINDTETILVTASKFCTTFGLSKDLAIQRYTEFLLSPAPESTVDHSLDHNRKLHADIRVKLHRLEATAKLLLRRFESPIKRCSILRTCAINLERSKCGTDYERLSLVFALYQEELGNAISQELKCKDIDPRPFVKELELTDRRRDALAILSSFFQGEIRASRPPFSSFFLPLNGSLENEAGPAPATVCHVLGRQTQTETGTLDPLDPLEPILRSNSNVAATAALAPLCLALGVPRGYIHARSLVARFGKAKCEDVALPSFEGDVLPVINRLNSSADKADLAEWCSARYDLDNEDRLKCLDLALKNAMQASSEAERFGGKNDAEQADSNASNALERVKRIRSTADMLADRSTVNGILRSGGATSEKHVCLARVIDALTLKLEEEVWSKHEFAPEEFINTFLSASSLLAAEASLDGKHALSMGQFRNLSILVHRTCKTIADKYSHVQVGSFVRRLTRRWLFHGDHHAHTKEEEGPKVVPDETRNVGANILAHMEDIDEADTMNFVMDLTNLRDDDNVWSADIGTGPSSNHDTQKLTSEEEPSSLRGAGSARESSELQSRRAALRIAFVMAFAEGCHSTSSDERIQDENSKPTGNRQSSSRSTSSKARGGLLSRIGSRGGGQTNEAVMEHGKELLHIVFAKSGSSDWIDRDLSTSLDTRSSEGVSRSEKRKIITFAMRHRALRAASVLCPQEALEEVVKEEGYIGLGATCTLKKCSFGVFVAKEIEEMGLPLPHSDLTQLSTMHFPSYARTLWRYHRDSDLKGSKGRLLLLILEMYLKENVTDAGFVVSILTEMSRLNLPRTLILAYETIGCYKERHGSLAFFSSMEEAGTAITTSMASVSNMVLSELYSCLSNDGESAVDSMGGFETVRRVGNVMQRFCETTDGQQNLLIFTEQLLKVAGRNQGGDFSDRIGDLVFAVLRRVKDKIEVNRLLEQDSVVCIEEKYFSKQSLRKSNLTQSKDKNEDSDLLSCALARFEVSLDNF